MKEIWKDIPGYGGFYSASNLGRIRSIRKDIILKSFIHPEGYRIIQLSVNGKKYSCKVHRLLAITFIPNPENKKTVNHINGIKLDNNILNLEWATISENIRHCHKLQLHSIDIYTEDDVRDIRYKYSILKLTTNEIAKQYNANLGTIKGIAYRLSRKHVLDK